MILREHPQEAYFDCEEKAWVLSRYADVSAAVREPQLLLAGARSTPTAAPLESERLQMRAETSQALTPALLVEWQKLMEVEAEELLGRLPVDHPVDLVAGFGRPWCLAVAVMVTGADPANAETLARLAIDVSAAAANPYDQTAKTKAKVATAALQPNFSSGPLALRDPGFVGLSQTLLSLLANMWLALATHPEEYARLRADGDLLPGAVDELLRYAGVPRTLYRFADADVTVNGVRIAKGHRVILRLAVAHRDPAQFSDPERLDLLRRAPAPLSLGAGMHSCVGAGLIRIAVAAGTRALTDRFEAVQLAGDLEWLGGQGFRTPRMLPVRLVACPA